MYKDSNNREFRIHTHMLLALAFVPPEDVEHSFHLLRDEVPDTLNPMMDYFSLYYVVGITTTGKRKRVQPRYPIDTWNHFEVTLNTSLKLVYYLRKRLSWDATPYGQSSSLIYKVKSIRCVNFKRMKRKFKKLEYLKKN
uniref:Uncharacterized protein n=1 Tax=Trichogramma kaykai TaxID=54128 RepID=A0ABD2XEN4_9HYME